MDKYLVFTHTIYEVKNMDKKTQEQIQEQKKHDKFNSITQKSYARKSESDAQFQKRRYTANKPEKIEPPVR